MDDNELRQIVEEHEQRITALEARLDPKNREHWRRGLDSK